MNERIKQLYLKTVDRNWAYDNEFESAEKFTKLLIEDVCMWLEGVHTSEEGMMLLTQSFIIANIKGYYGVKE
jgi:hypothetical protein